MKSDGHSKMEKKSGVRKAVDQKKRRARKLRAFLLTIVILLFIIAPVYRFYLRDQIKVYLITLAEKNINGTIEFDSIRINPVLGTARVLNARVTIAGESSPVVEIPILKLDIWPLRERQVVIAFEYPTLRVKRDKSGKVNLERLIKPAEERERQAWDVSLSFTGLNIEYRDLAGIPSEARARIRGEEWLAELESALENLGVAPDPAFEPDEFDYSLAIRRLNGTVEMDASDNFLSASFKGLIEESEFTADFRMFPDTGKVSANLILGEVKYGFVEPVVNQVSPFFAPLDPSLVIEGLEVSLARSANGNVGMLIIASLSDTGFKLPDYPRLVVERAEFALDTGTGQLDVMEADISFGEASLSVSGLVELEEGKLSLDAILDGLRLSSLPVELPMTGILRANVHLAGSRESPEVKGRAEITDAVFEGHRLGTLKAEFTATQEIAVIHSFEVSGGEISLKGSGSVTPLPSAEIDFTLARTPIAKLLRLGDADISVEGTVGVSGHLSLDALGGVEVSGRAVSDRMESPGLSIEDISVNFEYDGRNLLIENASFVYHAKTGVIVRSALSARVSNIESNAPVITFSGRTILDGVSRIETPEIEAPTVDFGDIMPPGDVEDLFYDPYAPKKGEVIASSDPSRVGAEVWWPRLLEHDEDSEDAVSGTGEAEGSEPEAPGISWWRSAVLSAAARGTLRKLPLSKVVVMSGSDPPVLTYEGKAELGVSSAGGSPSVSFEGDAELAGIFLKPIKIEVSSEGTLDDSQVYVTAFGRYKKRGFQVRAGYKLAPDGKHEYDARIDYGNSDFTLKGTLDVRDASIAASIKSEAIQLEDLLDLEGMYGSATLIGKVEGTLESPVVKGEILVEDAVYESKQSHSENTRPLAVVEIKSGKFPFSVDISHIELTDGSFEFGGSKLDLRGSVSEGKMDVVLSSSDFSLDDLANVFATNVDIQGTGTLETKLSGTVREPSLELNFDQDDGSIEGVPFSEVRLSLLGDREKVTITEIHIASADGYIDASGSLSLTGDFPISANVKISELEAGLISPLIFDISESVLEGAINGEIKVWGTLGSVMSTVDIRMSEGKILDQQLDKAILLVSLHEDEIVLDAFELWTGDSTVEISGVIREPLSESELTIDVRYLDLSLVNPFIGLTAEEGLFGAISMSSLVKSGERGPYMKGSISSSEDLGFGNISLAKVEGNFDIYPDLIDFKDFKLQTADSEIKIDGRWPFMDTGSGDEFDLSLTMEQFELDYLTTVLPEKIGLDIEGTVTADIRVSGRARIPVLNGTIEIDARNLRYQDIVSVGGIQGEIILEFDTEEAIQTFRLGIFYILDPMAGGESPKSGRKQSRKEDKDESEQVAEHTIEVGGGGTFRLAPFDLYDLDIEAELKGFENFQLKDFYKGPIEGNISLSKRSGDPNIYAGGSVTLGSGGVISLRVPKESASPPAVGLTLGTIPLVPESDVTSASETASPEDFSRISRPRLVPFRINIEKGVIVRFPAAFFDLRVEIQSEYDARGKIIPLKIWGDFPNDIKLEGKVESYKGSIFAYRHTFRVVDPPFTIRFGPAPLRGTETYVRGKAAVVIPGGAGGAVISDFGGFDDDLTIYVNIDGKITEREKDLEILLTSEPPLSPGEIEQRMLGVLPSESSVSGLSPEIREELYNVLGARVSRLLGEKLNIEQLRLRLGEENELYVDIEKEITDRISVLYQASFFGRDDLTNREQFGIRYRFLKKRLASAYIEGIYDLSDSGFFGNELNIVLRRKF